MRRVLRDNGLSITLFTLFLVFLVLQSIAGYKTTNSENEQHRQPPESFGEYLTSGRSLRRPSRTGRASSSRWARTWC